MTQETENLYDIVNYSLGSFTPNIEIQKAEVEEPKKEDTKKKEKIFEELEPTVLSMNYIDFYCDYYDIVLQIREAFSKAYGDKLNQPQFYQELQYDGQTIIDSIFEINHIFAPPNLYKDYVKMIYYDIFGLGMLEPMLSDETITEIMVVNHNLIFIEQNGKVFQSEFKFPNFENALGFVKKIIEPLNRRLNFSSPTVDAQLPDGSRLSASVPPMKADGDISITIRKFSKFVQGMEYYATKYQNMAFPMVDFLKRAVEIKTNIIVSGGTGSGKTTLLNALSFNIPANERIITCEDTLELQLQQPHVEPYLTVTANVEGRGGVTMQDIIVAALRKRPDRIIVGECRGGEIVEMLNAMNTGHDGSLSTIHANNPEDMIKRATTMILSNRSTSGLPQIAILQLLASAVQIIVQAQRLKDGSRRITAIAEVLDVGQEGAEMSAAKGFTPSTIDPNKLYMRNIFEFRQTAIVDGKIHGEFISTGYRPYLLDKIHASSIVLDDEEIFEKETVLLEIHPPGGD